MFRKFSIPIISVACFVFYCLPYCMKWLFRIDIFDKNNPLLWAAQVALLWDVFAVVYAIIFIVNLFRGAVDKYKIISMAFLIAYVVATIWALSKGIGYYL